MNKCNLVLAGVLAAGIAFPAKGQQLICLGSIAQTLSSDGNIVLGSLYEADIDQYILYTWTRAAGGHRLGVQPQGEGALRISTDGAVICLPGYNVENLGNLNYGRPQGWLDTSLARRWTLATGSVNLGIQVNGSACDHKINSPAAMSRNGQFFVGGGWANSGALCGPYRAWIYDNSTATFTMLRLSLSPPPASAPSSNTNAWGVSDDGNTVIGYDENYAQVGTLQRMATVWTKSGTIWTNFHLDPNGGTAGCVSGDGNVVFGNASTGSAVVRWVRNGSSWTKTTLGGSGTPLRTNIDGTKAVGEQFFWSADVNGGVPMDLTSYLISRGVNMAGVTISDPLGAAVQAMSDDGSKITFHASISPGACLGTFQSMMADLTNAACVPPGINFSPVSQPLASPASSGPYGIILNVFASGTWPLAFQWQKETTPGTWTNLTDDSCPSYDSASFDVRGADTSQLRLGFLGAFNPWQGRYRCVVTNACDPATTAVAVIGPPQPTCGSADFNCDGDIGTDADIEAFFKCLAGTCPASPCTSTADFNADGDIGTDADIEAFFRVLAGGTC